jgi:hypothetical protein
MGINSQAFFVDAMSSLCELRLGFGGRETNQGNKNQAGCKGCPNHGLGISGFGASNVTKKAKRPDRQAESSCLKTSIFPEYLEFSTVLPFLIEKTGTFIEKNLNSFLF